MAIAATLGLAAAAQCLWDVVVVGAGPAGAMAAHQLARQGRAVLLVDQASFPRWKVCGACLSGPALATLAAVGLEQPMAELGAVPLTSMHLAAGGPPLRVPLAGRVALSRAALDAALTEAAVRGGASFLPRTWARLHEVTPAARQVALRQDGQDAVVAARVVIAADGLGGTLCARAADVRTVVRADSRFGAGTVVECALSAYAPGTVFMACGAGGYVGLVRIEDGRLNIAGAFDPAAVRAYGGVGPLAAAILAGAGLPAVAATAWRGTPALTRHAVRPAGQRLFLAGDAASYMEPFTGDGIAGALAAGVAVARLAGRACRNWEPALAAEWSARYRHLVRRRQWACGVLAGVLRRPALAAAVAASVRHVPILRALMLRWLEG